jgi:hypothetical protein
MAYHQSASRPKATRHNLAISCCGCGSRIIFRNIAFGYAAPTKKTAATNSGISCLRVMLVLWRPLGTVGARRLFFGGANRPGEDHDKISTDRPSSGLVAEWSYVCHCSKWPSHRRVPAGHEKPKPLPVLWIQWLLRSTSLRAWNALLCSGLSRPTLWPL